jgi:hypothetical protein
MRARSLSLLLGAALAAGGCIEAQRVITVAPDGSGTIVDTIRPVGPMAALMQMGQDEKTRGEEKVKKTPRFKSAATAMGAGVRLESFEPMGGGNPEVIRYAFSDIAQVKAELLPFFGNDDEEAVTATPLSFKFSRPGATSTLTVLTPPEKPDPGAKKATQEEIDKNVAQMKQMSAQLKGLKMSGKLEVGGPIVKSNGAFVEGSTVTLLEIDFETLAQDEASMRRLAALEDPTKADPRVLAGIKGLKVNALPALTVEFKSR